MQSIYLGSNTATSKNITSIFYYFQFLLLGFVKFCESIGGCERGEFSLISYARLKQASKLKLWLHIVNNVNKRKKKGKTVEHTSQCNAFQNFEKKNTCLMYYFFEII